MQQHHPFKNTDVTEDSSLASTLQMNAMTTDPTLLAMQQKITQLTQMVTQMTANQQNQGQQQQYQGQQQQQGRSWEGRGRGRSCSE